MKQLADIALGLELEAEQRWQLLCENFSWLETLRGCEQEPKFHGEGDVFTHTRMVFEALIGGEKWQRLNRESQIKLALAALLHDVGKPACTVVEDGRIRSPRHALIGAGIARRLLWELELQPQEREQIVALVRLHHLPFFLFEREAPQRSVLWASITAGCKELATLSEADIRGRICEDQVGLLDTVELFAEYCREQSCFQVSYPFASDHSRFEYFRTADRDPAYHAFEQSSCEVTVMSGLPGAGKDTWIAENCPGLPVVSLDQIRAEHSIKSTDNQSRVVSMARDQAKEHLRSKRSFVWNATNISRMQRGKCIDLAAAYGARVRVVSVETTPTELYTRNRTRERPVPRAVINQLINRWEPPDLSESHELEVV